MSVTLAITLLGLGLAGGGLAGLLGIGGGIVLVPLLLYVPPLLGIAALSMKEVAGVTIAQVMVASFSGFLTHRRRRAVHLGLGLWMGAPSLAGSWAGGLASGSVSSDGLLGLFALVAAVSGIMIFARSCAVKPVVLCWHGRANSYHSSASDRDPSNRSISGTRASAPVSWASLRHLLLDRRFHHRRRVGDDPAHPGRCG